jgi:hypothetical protein
LCDVWNKDQRRDQNDYITGSEWPMKKTPQDGVQKPEIPTEIALDAWQNNPAPDKAFS